MYLWINIDCLQSFYSRIIDQWYCTEFIQFLHFLGRMFQDLLDPFLRVSLHKGIPSLFIGLRPFYKDPEKVRVHNYIQLLGKFR